MAKEDTSAMMAALTGIQSSQGMRKAAILMVALGEEISSKVMAYLDDEEVSDLSKEIALTRVVPPEQIDEVVEEFYNMMLAKKFISKGGLEYAKSILVKSLGPERARKIIDRLTKMLEQSSGFEFLTKIDPKQLAKFIMNEHPQTIALILAHLDPSHAAESMAQLPEELKAEVAVRIANLQDISPAVVKTLSKVLEERFEALSSYNVEVGGVKSVAEIFNRMDRVASKTTLDRLEKDSPELVAKIRDMMFVFDDIKVLGTAAIQEILKSLICQLYHPDIAFGVVVDIGLKIIKEIDILILIDSVTYFPFFQLLFLLKPYFLGKFQCLPVLFFFLWLAGMFEQIQVEVFFLPMMLNLVLRLTCHFSRLIQYRIPCFIY